MEITTVNDPIEPIEDAETSDASSEHTIEHIMCDQALTGLVHMVSQSSRNLAIFRRARELIIHRVLANELGSDEVAQYAIARYISEKPRLRDWINVDKALSCPDPTTPKMVLFEHTWSLDVLEFRYRDIFHLTDANEIIAFHKNIVELVDKYMADRVDATELPQVSVAGNQSSESLVQQHKIRHQLALYAADAARHLMAGQFRLILDRMMIVSFPKDPFVMRIDLEVNNGNNPPFNIANTLVA
ncbi:uncharacterized protein GGS25DRAFT_520769 [Hypoxylon fragiforme]|uniref:uncharacterized protein n=1 Tax=Hypoxylon fragiforme TaxID=63214 RepID=UPI0020C69178|nr:uncharacterized protein GGS25DRAFT_520769 [Hypoxylon fragiforme]KAI2609965.1 hypothetical protein GGS25DRAFT_520769 [Hypoxylon fragiforme]